jgi:amino acid adenylation domain-containing protein
VQEAIALQGNDPAPTGRGSDIVSVFEAVVQRAPDATALLAGERRLSYRELNGRAQALARHMHDLGVAKGARVALCLERSVEMIVGILATLKLGAAYVAIDHGYPLERIRFILDDSAPALTLTTSTLDPAILAELERPVFLDTLFPNAPREASDAQWPAGRCDTIDPSCPAYVMYTSGTTGQPKGAVLPHSGICRLVRDTNYLDIGASDVLLHHSTCSFDAAVFEIWAALLNGATLVLYPPKAVELSALKRCIRERGITTLLLTTAVFHLVAEHDPECLATLKLVVIGGDVLHARPVRKIIGLYPHLTLINGYGPTENAVFTCCHVITRDTVIGDSIPIGKPITGTNVYILGPDLPPVSPGETGELFTDGLGLASGYLNRSEMTRKSFVAVPSLPGAPTLYRTGDLVREDADGNIFFIGRADLQVKIRGFRVEPAEVEAALLALPGVTGAVVLVERGGTAGTENNLHACVSLQQRGPTPDAQAVRTRLMAKLPQYMVPAFITVVDGFPLTHNGKIDSAALRALTADRRKSAATVSVAGDDPGGIVLSVWREKLGAPQLGGGDCVCDYGASSLTSIIVQNELDRRFNLTVDPLELARADTPKAWAAIYLKALQQGDQGERDA